MKADRNPKPKAPRRLSIPEDDYPECRYFNDSAVGLKFLFERTADGQDLEYLERLKRVHALIMEVAGAPETYLRRAAPEPTSQPVALKPAPKLAMTLQELLDPPRHIPQLDLCEYLNARRVLEVAQSEADNLGSLIVAKIVRKFPVQRGPLVATIDSKGCLAVREDER
jgi:hypothetical protein